MALSGALLAQSQRFEVASIRRHPPGEVVAPGAGGFKSSPDGLTANYTTLRMFVQWAYNVSGEVSGPGWLDEERYDISARCPGPTDVQKLKLMLQSLLEERFDLKVHFETKEVPASVLIVSRQGIRDLQPIDDPGKLEIQRGNGILLIRNASMGSVANILGSPLGNMPLERVLDQTGLRGFYNIKLDLRSFDRADPAFAGNYQEMRNALRQVVSDALERQYGLKLEQRKVPLQSIVVDSANKVPAEN